MSSKTARPPRSTPAQRREQADKPPRSTPTPAARPAPAPPMPDSWHNQFFWADRREQARRGLLIPLGDRLGDANEQMDMVRAMTVGHICDGLGVADGGMPYPLEVAVAELMARPLREAQQGRRLAALREENKALREELTATVDALTETFRDLQAMTMRPEYHATARAILAIATLNHGAVIQDLYQALQTGVFQVTAKEDSEPFVVKLRLKASIQDEDGISRLGIAAEVQLQTPPDKSDGVAYLDADNCLTPPAEAVKQLPLLISGQGAA